MRAFSIVSLLTLGLATFTAAAPAAPGANALEARVAQTNVFFVEAKKDIAPSVDKINGIINSLDKLDTESVQLLAVEFQTVKRVLKTMVTTIKNDTSVLKNLDITTLLTTVGDIFRLLGPILTAVFKLLQDAVSVVGLDCSVLSALVADCMDLMCQCVTMCICIVPILLAATGPLGLVLNLLGLLGLNGILTIVLSILSPNANLLGDGFKKLLTDNGLLSLVSILNITSLLDLGGGTLSFTAVLQGLLGVVLSGPFGTIFASIFGSLSLGGLLKL